MADERVARGLAAMAGHPDRVDLSYHSALDRPAISRYAATTPQLLNWFRVRNQKLAYGDQVRPFNFLSAFQASRFSSNSDDADSLGAEIQTKGRRKRHCVLKPIAPCNAGAARASFRGINTSNAATPFSTSYGTIP